MEAIYFSAVTFLAEGGNPLKIEPLSILFHIINLIILVALLWKLLYKPVKKFMDGRKAEFADMQQKQQLAAEEVAAVKADYAKMVEQGRADAAEASERHARAARERGDAMILEAEKRAKEIVDSAIEEAEAEKLRAAEDMRRQVGAVGLEVAKKLIGRELTQADDAEIIERCLEEWSK